jgi:hypothetical protein
MIRERVRKYFGPGIPRCRGWARAARRRALRTDMRWQLANERSLPFRLAQVRAYVAAMAARIKSGKEVS